ncbi:MAG: hypothetical protein KatS3mg027_2095 [Bacteroidia bacterium]|nr:MAG: hypothetical protein KatS3mg027_2095 [Bacteroidia bacterium]
MREIMKEMKIVKKNKMRILKLIGDILCFLISSLLLFLFLGHRLFEKKLFMFNDAKEMTVYFIFSFYIIFRSFLILANDRRTWLLFIYQCLSVFLYWYEFIIIANSEK